MFAPLLTLLLHLPNASGPGAYGTAEDAFIIEDIDKSIVLYDTVECSAEQLWMTFDGRAGSELFVQLGVPVLERLADYRPHLAVVAPGLPESSLPFDLPDGLGAVSFPTDDVTASNFDEPFSGTQSWILREETLVLPQDGVGYIVAWTPSRETGKQWVAVGTIEDFSGGLPIPLEEVQAFHEVGEFTPTEPVVESVCMDAAGHDDSGHDDSGHDETGDHDHNHDPGSNGDPGGCSVNTGANSNFVWALFLLPGLLRRRAMRGRIRPRHTGARGIWSSYAISERSRCPLRSGRPIAASAKRIVG